MNPRMLYGKFVELFPNLVEDGMRFKRNNHYGIDIETESGVKYEFIHLTDRSEYKWLLRRIK